MKLFFRTQASPQIGMGHFMRCYALAEAARAEGWEVTFLLDELSPAVAERLGVIGADGQATFCVVAAEGDLADVAFTRDDWLVIDSYDATADYIRDLTGRVRTAVLDDLNALGRFDCDLLINPAMAAPRMGYEARTSGRVLLGESYGLIRREFTASHVPDTEEATVTVTFGGADPTQMTAACTWLLHDALPDTIIKVIAGPANTHTSSLLGLEKQLRRMRLYVSPPSVADVLAGSALVITAAGGSVGEIAAMGLPALVLVVYDNQKAALAACPYPVIDARAGLPDDLGARVAAMMADPDERARNAAHAYALVDGRGPQRILEAMRHV